MYNPDATPAINDGAEPAGTRGDTPPPTSSTAGGMSWMSLAGSGLSCGSNIRSRRPKSRWYCSIVWRRICWSSRRLWN
ncbi:hypothetical protein BD779DRAFT_1527838 [Infundibulicybe gibba]|nr:hypothetical protein BD779DRAFT_1527838 [Infundibulicybe gibba]